MEVLALLEENREVVLGRWFQRIAGSYPEATSKFLAKQKDRFRNPVGHAISESTGSIYDQLLSAMDTGRLLEGLDGIIRIRSVQDFTPTETVAFVFELKDVIREVVGERIQGAAGREGLREVESRIDRVALLAFEKYTQCREDLHRVRNREVESRAWQALHGVRTRRGLSRLEEGADGDED